MSQKSLLVFTLTKQKKNTNTSDNNVVKAAPYCPHLGIKNILITKLSVALKKVAYKLIFSNLCVILKHTVTSPPYIAKINANANIFNDNTASLYSAPP